MVKAAAKKVAKRATAALLSIRLGSYFSPNIHIAREYIKTLLKAYIVEVLIR